MDANDLAVVHASAIGQAAHLIEEVLRREWPAARHEIQHRHRRRDRGTDGHMNAYSQIPEHDYGIRKVNKYRDVQYVGMVPGTDQCFTQLVMTH